MTYNRDAMNALPRTASARNDFRVIIRSLYAEEIVSSSANHGKSSWKTDDPDIIMTCKLTKSDEQKTDCSHLNCM